jgi:hypothetical protein
MSPLGRLAAEHREAFSLLFGCLVLFAVVGHAVLSRRRALRNVQNWADSLGYQVVSREIVDLPESLPIKHGLKEIVVRVLLLDSRGKKQDCALVLDEDGVRRVHRDASVIDEI